MIIGYVFSRHTNVEFPIIANDSCLMNRQKQNCEDCFYFFLRENLLAKMLSIEDFC